RGGMTEPVLFDRIKRTAAVGVDDDGGEGRRGRNASGGAMRDVRQVADVRVMDGAVVMVVAMAVGVGRHDGEKQRGRCQERSRGDANDTTEMRVPITPRHERAPILHTQLSGSCSTNTHERYGDAVTARLTECGKGAEMRRRPLTRERVRRPRSCHEVVQNLKYSL